MAESSHEFERTLTARLPDNPKRVANGERTGGVDVLFGARAIVCETRQPRTRRDELF
jgi:hypothetical protein